MAKTKRDTLSYEQERTIRNFLGSCDFTKLTLPAKMRGELIRMLGYKSAPNGALVWKSIECRWRFGENIDDRWIDTFESDWETLCAERNTTDSDSATDTSASEPTEGN